MIEIQIARDCPFAQRVAAVLTHLGVPFHAQETELEAGDDASSTRAAPVLVDGKLRLRESTVICGYLAERFDWRDAFADDLGLRARQRLAMLDWDSTVVPAFAASLGEAGLDTGAERALAAALKELVKTVHGTDGRVGDLLSFHVAPFWLRFGWVADLSPVAGIVGEWIDLKRWLDAAIAQPAIQATLPDRERTVATYRENLARA